ncbi:hypothetical protein GBAR_LOCUS20925 [Geodia barretti]|uniref:Uncharacterized protein n=1 Tax=Geodia barretti TaxID=519541 RepID=A0AA35SXW9_GEOBA|nr:hypothetical protein GBAR_LOCUS20925 [Geodia barretti]
MSLTTTHTKLRMLHLDSSDSTVLQTHFHTFLLQAIVEFVGVLCLSYYLIRVLSPTSKCSLHDVSRTLVLASCGRLSGLAAMVWTGDFYLWIPWLLTIPVQYRHSEIASTVMIRWNPSNLVSLEERGGFAVWSRSLLNTSLLKSATLVSILTLSLLLAGVALGRLRDTLLSLLYPCLTFTTSISIELK